MVQRANRSGYGDGGRGYGNGEYGAAGGDSRGDAYPRQDAYADCRSPYDRQARRSPYDRQDPSAQRSPYDQRSPYGQQDPYAQQNPHARQGGRPAAHQPAYASTYPVGTGRTYESSRANRAAGVQPVTQRDYAQSAYNSTVGAPGGKRPMNRRAFVGMIGGIAVAAVAGIAGVGWWTHRAVACTVNGSPREAPIGSTADELIKRGYAYPSPGNLVSICGEGEVPEVLTKGGGTPYTLTVNGAPVDVATYRLGENDQLEFSNGTDVTEQTIVQNTEIPCGIQIPDPSLYLAPIGYVAQWGKNGVATVETGSVSGKVIDRGVTQEPQDLIIAVGNINPADGRRLVALTFDDGPSETYTPQYLDILAAYGARATFFNLGSVVEESGSAGAAIMQRIVNEGHQLASHTYSHNSVTLSGMDVSQRNEDIRRGFSAIENATGFQTNVMRPPYGEFRGYQYLQYIAAGGDIAYSAFWGVDSADWELPGADAIVANCTHGLSGDNYNGAVILMHDGGGDRSQDVAALPRIIETFQAAGYQLVTMDEMIAADPTYPAWVSSGNAARPADAVVPDITPYV